MLDRLLLLCEKYPLDFITHLSSSLPVLLGLLRYKYLSLSSKLIIAFFISYFLIESLGTWLSLLKSNNLYLQNIEAIVETLFVLGIALASLQSLKWKRLTLFFAALSLTASAVTYQQDAVSSMSQSAFRLFAIFVCLSYFSKILMDVSVKNILLHTLFWFISGLLIYTSGTFFIMLFSEYWYKDINKVSAEVFDKYWNSSQVLFIIFCCLSAYGLWSSKYDQDNTL
ncbi:hypothetical protein Slin_5843 [Spirosoma linguale DSM 74]|uniref:Uncharacterized protein n=2 Tax=Spirosoma TaxID=107 RepID=D2QSM6_SPILD|nr:hypothetical protein Slin_5843 [Spirosoma linguale DSM 74]